MAHSWCFLACVFTAAFGFLHARPSPIGRSSLRPDNRTVVYAGNATYYDPGLGACGIQSNGNESVCAIADSLYDTLTINGNPNNNGFCNRRISVTGPKGTTTVRIVDRCGSCKNVDLDLSRVAFNQIGDPINGHIPINWRFI